MNLENLEKILANQPKFRLKQIYRAIYHDLIKDWSKASNLPLALRQELSAKSDLNIQGDIFKSKSLGTIKVLITLSDGLKIESVLLQHNDGRNTVCVSCQVGCALDCQFCATGQMGFKRNLDCSEILEQILFFSRYLKTKNQKVTNVVFMGMGEPFLNYDNVIKAVRILNDPDCFNIGARKISISTGGIIEGIKKLTNEDLQVNLAISLHAPENALRSRLMPINKTNPLKDLILAVNNYIRRTSRKVMLEYMMIKDVNDSVTQARQLAKLVKDKLYVVNLIPYNITGKFQPSSGSTIKEFKKVLEKEGINVTQRFSFGHDINASCGQLATKSLVNNKTAD
ncbi:MAG: 23S rRNA (adenine(2503)-C(2))-methyltransferase [Candidatus Buchananbacteria bacterium RIFCSPHIGHO2_02_FULL_38_8]|uniref:Probable dual-specificity RNA methyltransferase RlmN n=1 Tax=Candidatus Buchananbacteria bacterium RIFCSPHIGHO2_02_FULL_38_8 TaxID=1797538 RepID=A0A1G1Y6L6_9BACT|nr:MAG: 23S rRNA (adenine(2503)-C(2))-methyltransferase [Candidatus Buchananbacteria bacterium RIFCSPHIGHO2_02_FULL_38_8]